MSILALTATPALAESYACHFAIEDGEAKARLERAGDGWTLTVEKEVAQFREVTGAPEGLHLLSTDFDTDAGAVTLLSVMAGGEAMVSVHGNFPRPDGEIFFGSCEREAD